MAGTNRAITAGLLVWLAGIELAAGQRGAGPGPAGQPPAPIGIIVGRVVDAGTGQPVAEAAVTVSMRAPAPPPSAPGGATPVAVGGGPNNVRLLTGEDGRFVVRDLPAGNVMLNASAPGYLDGQSGQTRPRGQGFPVQITPENRTISTSIRLWKHASVSGMVTDERNEPAVGIMVRAQLRSFRNGQPYFTWAGMGRTDDRGIYRISGLAPGDYVVLVPQSQSTMPVAVMDEAMQAIMGGQGLGGAGMEVAAGLAGAGGGMGVRVGDQIVNSQSGAMPVLGADGRMAAYVTQYHPAGSAPAEATVLSLASGESRSGIDIRMPLVPTSRITGTVIGPDGPLGSVQVRLVNGADPDGDVGNDIARSMTSASGSFQLHGVPAGQYVLKVLRTPRQPLPAAMANNPQLAALMGGRGAGPASPSDSLTLFADVPLSVERDITDLAITLSTGASVSGRVEFIGTATVPPFTGVTVGLTPATGPPFAFRPTAALEDGRFSTSGYPAGKYLVTAGGRTPGWFLKSAMVNGVDALEQPFDLTAENIGNVIVTFTDRQSAISGTVIDASSSPVQATVIVFPAAYREWIARGMSARLTRNARTPAKGTFSIPDLPARDYLIVALADDQVPDLQNPTVFEALARAATSVTLMEGDTKTISLKIAQVVR